MSDLIGLIIVHLALGVALAACLWTVGLGLLALAGLARPDEPARLVFAYPLGLAYALLAALAFLLQPVLGAIVAALGLIPLVAVARIARSLWIPVRRALRPLAVASPFVVGLPFAIGELLHGPTASVPSSAYGDYVFWATRTVSAAQSIAPFRDLLVAGKHATYVEGSTTFMGAVLTHVPGFDVFLFQTTTLPLVFGASLCLGIGFLAQARREAGGAEAAVIASLLAIALIAYPSWLPESPPVSLAAPLAFALFAFWREPLAPPVLVALAAVTAFDVYLTKGFVGVLLLLVVGAALARGGRAVFRPTGRWVVLAAVAGVLAALALWDARGAPLPHATLRFVPWNAARGAWKQLHQRDTQAAWPAFAVAGQLLLVFALARARAWIWLACLGASLAASWTVEGYGFDLAVGMSIFLAALFFWDDPARVRRDRLVLAAAGACVAIAVWFRDISGYRAGFVFVVLLGALLVTAFLAAEGQVGAALRSGVCAVVGLGFGLAGHPAFGLLAIVTLAAVYARPMPVPASRWVAWTGLGLAVAAAGVVIGASIARGDFRIATERTTLSPDDYDIWHKVGQLVPRGALVLTSMTGERVDGRHGWNYYPGIAGRQLYVGGWYDGRLLVEPRERARRLQENRRLLEGRLSPAGLDLGPRFRAFYVVLRRGEARPATFRLVYANDRFALYRIES